MARIVKRYRAGRFIAALLTVVGWAGVGLGLAFTVYSLATLSMGGVVNLLLVLGALCCVLIGQIGRAVFDMAERDNGTGG